MNSSHNKTWYRKHHGLPTNLSPNKLGLRAVVRSSPNGVQIKINPSKNCKSIQAKQKTALVWCCLGQLSIN